MIRQSYFCITQMKVRLIAFFFFAIALGAQGAVTLGFGSDGISRFRNSQYSYQGPSAQMVWGIVVDGGNDGFDHDQLNPYLEGFSLTGNTAGIQLSTTWQGVSDDRLYISPEVMYLFGGSGSNATDNVVGYFQDLQFGGSVNAGDKFAIIWFDVLSLGGTAAKGIGYGFLEDNKFVLPEDGGFFSENYPVDTHYPKDMYYHLGVAFPEPSTTLFAFISLPLVLRRRRR